MDICFRREVSVTFVDVFRLVVGHSSERIADLAIAIEYALNEVDRIRERLMREGKDIAWEGLSPYSMPGSAVGVLTHRIVCNDIRFRSSVELRSDIATRLLEYAGYMAPSFPALTKRKPYRPFVIATLFRAVLAGRFGVLPTKDIERG